MIDRIALIFIQLYSVKIYILQTVKMSLLNVLVRTKSQTLVNNNISKMCQERRIINKLSASYIILVLTFLHLSTHNVCNAIPPVIQNTTTFSNDNILVSDILSNTRTIKDEWLQEESLQDDPENISSTTPSTYLDHKGLFCGARLSDLVNLNVTAR